MDEINEIENSDFDINLDDMLKDITPSLITPKLSDILEMSAKVRPKQISYIMIRGLAASIKNPVKKDILHKGAIHTIYYVDVEPLCQGSWAMLSLMLLNLSFGEQCTLIDALYPDNLQLSAKAFAAYFTPEVKSNTVIIKQDEELLKGIESANAGIAMIISLLKNVTAIPHTDEIFKNKEAMDKLVEAARERDKYQKSYKKSQEVAKFQDTM